MLLQGSRGAGRRCASSNRICSDTAESDFFAAYDRGIIDVIDNNMLIRYRTDHQSLTRRLLRGAYRRGPAIAAWLCQNT